MLLWTIQHKTTYDILLETGRLIANEKSLLFEGAFRSSYDWLAKQMKKRIGMPPNGVRYPIWAWYQWEGVRKRPDMRTHRYGGKKGIPIVLLSIDVPDNMVLLSDFDMWHVILNDGYLPLYEKDDIEYPSEDEKLKSWENVFCIDEVTDCWYIPKSTQATFWELKKNGF
ncbi:DUF3841 domain-containing protein [Lachnoanaerobaculum gingivalis]|uniref:DUF3841 domain-containing protein n=1 Tax=Lachnoanaerobaculum gingivalis TaxID=2490855 RepID=UPI0024A76050|nr:DUF3841 domain-containing protein [Lachnoanaerobaculum gingivalis]WHE88346.1 DUF3841 domain-containing protein [Lachnoanaerobaculum gingivalis]